MKRNPLLFALVAAAGLLTSLLRADETHYELAEIVPPAGGSLFVDNSSYPTTLFESGRVFGYFQSGATYRAFVWHAGTFTDLGLAPGGFSRDVREIDSTGNFLGKYTDVLGLHLILWQNAAYTEISPPAGATLLSAFLTDTGRAAGILTDSNGLPQVYVWFNGTFTIASPPPGSSSLYMKSITPAGRILGSFENTNGDSRLFTAIDGVFTDITPPDAPQPINALMSDSGLIGGIYWHADNLTINTYAAFTWANGVLTAGDLPIQFDVTINAIIESGGIVGSFYNSNNQHRTFTWSNGVFTELTPPVIDKSYINSTNEAGRILGYFDANGNSRAFTWFNGVLTDLTPLGAVRSYPVAINAAGDIIGIGYDSDDVQRSFTWSNGTLTDLTPSDALRSYVQALNSDGRIIGTYGYDNAKGNYRQHAFTKYDGVFTDLHPISLENERSYAAALNDSGEVLVTVESVSRMWLAELKDGPAPDPTPDPNSNSDSDSDSGTDAGPSTTAPPTASISGKHSLVTTKSTFRVKGKSAGNVTSIRYRVGKGKWQKMRSTGKWRFPAKLKPGKNVIKVIAIGPNGKSKPVKVTITRKSTVN